MRRAVVITQVIDPDHPALGATVAKIRALGAPSRRGRRACPRRRTRCPVVELPGSHIRGAGRRAERGVRLELALSRELRPRPILVLAHMAPIYAVLAAPWCRPLRVPLLLWYTHPHHEQHAAAGGARVECRRVGRRSLVPPGLRKARRDRARDRSLRVPPRAAGPPPAAPVPVAGPVLAGQGHRDHRARAGARP